jgi:hypothetical protein
MLAAQCKEIHHVATLLNKSSNLPLDLEMTKLVRVAKESVGRLNTINLLGPLVKLPKIGFYTREKTINTCCCSNLRRQKFFFSSLSENAIPMCH